MPEFFLELFSEEIPARMQASGARTLKTLIATQLNDIISEDILLDDQLVSLFWGPRRIAISLHVLSETPAVRTKIRGPRVGAPDAALDGFLKKNNVSKEHIRQEEGYFIAELVKSPRSAVSLIAEKMPVALRNFSWPKSMRWGGTSSFTWVRPLRRITCLLDGAVVPFDLREGDDDGHGLMSGNLTEGHRFLANGTIEVNSFADWVNKLRAAHVLVDANERRLVIGSGIYHQAKERHLTVVGDDALLDEVAGLVEWPVPLLGKIDAAFMDLPAEVMQVSMRVNQRYFALRDAEGRAAPYFAFAANVIAPDGGATIIAGNERVLRARFSDARHFWDLDRTRTLESRVAALDAITFHAKLGSQGARVRRIMALAAAIAPTVGADPALASRAALLAKADLTTGMVGEFPELQGVMGGYYAAHDGEAPEVAAAVRDHYLPKGPGDASPTAPTTIAVALADKLDTLAEFFRIGEKPTGSGDPYALRRAALGVIRIFRENALRLDLAGFLAAHTGIGDTSEILAFFAERLRVQLRAEGARHDVLSAVLEGGTDIVLLLARTDAVASFLATDDGANLLAAYRRAANILRAEEKKDGPHDGPIDPSLLEAPEEVALAQVVSAITPKVKAQIAAETFGEAMSTLANLRTPLDAFFTAIQVNAARPELRRNRLRLLAAIRAAMHMAADFARIEG